MFYDRSNIDVFNRLSGALSDDEYRIKAELERLEHIDSMEQAANYMLALAGLPFNEARALPFIGSDAIKSQQQKRKEQDQNFLLWHLVYRFQQNLNRIDQRIAEIDKSLNALNEVQVLIDNHAFDHHNKEHLQLLLQTGIDPGAFAHAPDTALQERKELLISAKADLTELRHDLIHAAEDSTNSNELDQRFEAIEGRMETLFDQIKQPTHQTTTQESTAIEHVHTQQSLDQLFKPI